MKQTKGQALSRVQRFGRFYLTLVVAIAVAMALSVVIAVFLDVLVGLIVAVLSAILYNYLKKLALSRYLGLAVRMGEEGLCVTALSAGGSTLYTLPRRLMWLDVTELEAGALEGAGNESLSCLTLPDTLTRLDRHALSGAPALSALRFGGSAEAFAALSQGLDLSALSVTVEAKEETAVPDTADGREETA